MTVWLAAHARMQGFGCFTWLPNTFREKIWGLSQTLRHLSSWGTIGPFHSTYQRTKTAQHANLKQDMWICKGSALYTYTCIDTGSILTIINVYMTFEVCCIFSQTGGIYQTTEDIHYTCMANRFGWRALIWKHWKPFSWRVTHCVTHQQCSFTNIQIKNASLFGWQQNSNWHAPAAFDHGLWWLEQTSGCLPSTLTELLHAMATRCSRGPSHTSTRVQRVDIWRFHMTLHETSWDKSHWS